MGGTFYIFKSGNLKRKDNNIVIQSLDGQRKNLKSETMMRYTFLEKSA